MTMTNLWRACRVLEHLWIPRFSLGLGSTVVTLGGGRNFNSSMTEESILRLGGIYDGFPNHVNYCKEIWAGVHHMEHTPIGMNKQRVLPPKQTSTYAFLTEHRACDFQIIFHPDPEMLAVDEDSDDDWGDEFEEEVEDAEDVQRIGAARSSSVGSGSLMGWIGFGGGSGKDTESSSTETLHRSKSEGNTQSLSKRNTPTPWEVEKEILEKRYRI